MELLTKANTSAYHDSVVMIPKNFTPQDVFTSKALIRTRVWIKE